MRILVDGAHVEHWLNGEKVVDYELWSDDWKQRVARSKHKDRPSLAPSRKVQSLCKTTPTASSSEASGFACSRRRNSEEVHPHD